MAKWVRSGVLDNGLNDIKSNSVQMLLLATYTAGDSAATVAANALASAAMTSADYTITSVGSDRKITAAAKVITSASAASASGNRHIAHVDASGAPIWVTDETTDPPNIAIGARVSIPAHSYTAPQPV
jgi:hypothetical protein